MTEKHIKKQTNWTCICISTTLSEHIKAQKVKQSWECSEQNHHTAQTRSRTNFPVTDDRNTHTIALCSLPDQSINLFSVWFLWSATVNLHASCSNTWDKRKVRQWRALPPVIQMCYTHILKQAVHISIICVVHVFDYTCATHADCSTVCLIHLINMCYIFSISDWS